MIGDELGYVHSFESFGLVDGPGVRSVIFLQGCNMRCRYCHNPETWKTDVGDQMTAKQVFDKAYRYKNYWRDNGGITVSGGEPLLQIDFVTELFTLAREKGVNTTLDSSGNPFSDNPDFMEKFEKLMSVTDLVMLDIKMMDEKKHKALTGHNNDNIIKMARWLSDNNKDMWIRRVLVPGLTDDEEDLRALGELIHSLKTVKKVEVLPYHTLGTFKWEKLGIDYSLEGVRVPTEDEVKRAEELLGQS